MNPTLTKRKYETHEEMERDFWRIHYQRETTGNRPNERLWERMHEDGIGSVAERLWNNQYRMLNGGGCWIPCHGPTVRRLFPENVESTREADPTQQSTENQKL